jgi:hypothetical protein
VYPQATNDDAEDDYNQGQGNDSSNNDNSANAMTSYSDPVGDSLYKMHWEKYYFWQEETIERKWCIQCFGDNPGARARIVDCDSGDGTRLTLERQSSSNHFRIRVSGGDLCLARPVTNMDYSLFERCDDGDEQLWMNNKGDAFGSGDFEFTPKTQPGDCLTITHQPRLHELLWVSTCEYTEGNHASLWERYEINS